MTDFDFDAATITNLHCERTERWHQEPTSVSATGLLEHVERNHQHNFELWHHEDNARRDDMGFEFVYQAKRAIDHHNQQRNNGMEAMDRWFYEQLSPKQQGCPINSETPGMMIDRLSILALKLYHMQEQVDRADASAEHKTACQQKCAVITAQKNQLQHCLAELIDAVKKGERSFRVYYQFKMYNDPNLNPQLYRQHAE